VSAPRITAITPTCPNRPSLARAVGAIRQQLGPDDRQIIVGDGPVPAARDLVAALADPRISYVEGPHTHFWGYAQREYGMKLANLGHYLFWADDDNLVRPNCFTELRKAMAEFPGRPVCYYMVNREGFVYNFEQFQKGLIGGPMFVCPNFPDRLGSFNTGRYESDFDFITSTLKKGWPQSVWVRQVLMEIDGARERNPNPGPGHVG